MARKRRQITAVGTYQAAYWPRKEYYDVAKMKNVFTYSPEKPDHRQVLVRLTVGEQPHSDPYYAASGLKAFEYKDLTSEELLNAELTTLNSDSLVRAEQGRELAHAGYGGPVGGGEARGLKNLFTELGMLDLIKRGWMEVSVTVWRKPTKWMIRRAAYRNQPVPAPSRVKTTKLQLCYVFKSPLEGVHFSKFIRLARMYKDDKGRLKAAVRAVLANPEAANEIEALDAMELLAGMTGME